MLLRGYLPARNSSMWRVWSVRGKSAHLARLMRFRGVYFQQAEVSITSSSFH